MKNIKLTLVPAIAAAVLFFAGCSSEPDQEQLCVDRNNTRVDPKRCEDEGRNPNPMPFYYWYWMTRGASQNYPVGHVIPMGQGTRYVPSPSYRPPSSGGIFRGGFGSSAHGVGG